MTKAIEGFSFTLPVASGSVPQYRAVKESSGQALLPTANTDVIVGVIQNKTTATGQAGTIVSSGIVVVEAAEAIAKGALVGIEANTGKAVAQVSAKTRLGQAQEASAAAGDLIGVLLAPMGVVAP